MLFLRISPRLIGLFRLGVHRPLRQRQSLNDIVENHPNARPDTDVADHVWSRKDTIRGRQVADDPKRLIFGRLTLLGIEVHQQDHIRRVDFERWLNRVMHFLIGMH